MSREAPHALELSASVRSRRSFPLAVLVSAVVVVPLFGPSSAARAGDDSGSGRTVVGELVQAWSEQPAGAASAGDPDRGGRGGVAPTHGKPVRVPTADVAHIDVGATVAVVVGDEV